MNAQQFIDTYTNKQVLGANDGYVGQCVDLAQLYAQEVVGWANPYLGNAKDWWTNFDKSRFDAIPNTIGNSPQLGDIVIWGMQPYGHIAIAVGGNPVWFKSLDNNWPWGLDQNYHPATIVTHNYNNVIGWLRPKGDQMTPEQLAELKRLRADVEALRLDENRDARDIQALRKDTDVNSRQIGSHTHPTGTTTLAPEDQANLAGLAKVKQAIKDFFNIK